MEEYKQHYNEKNFWEKLGRFAKKLGIQSVYTILLLFYAFKRKETPKWAKGIIVGLLGYFLAPIDFLPDLTPFLGYTDDIGLLGFGLVSVAAYVDMSTRIKARKQLKKWFGDFELTEIKVVDDKI